MSVIGRFLFFFIFTCLSSKADIRVNSEWVRVWGNNYEFKISPSGTARPVYQGDGMTCQSRWGNECETMWRLRISGGGEYYCPNNFLVSRGVSYESLLLQINSRMMSTCQFPTSRHYFTGNEEVCLQLLTFGPWVGPSRGNETLVHFSSGNSGSCNSGSGQGGSEVQPPVQPVSCHVSQEYISLQHPALAASELNGHRKEVSFSVFCNRDSSVNLRVTGLDSNGRLALNQNFGLYSRLTINDVSAQKGITLNTVGTNGVVVNMVSTLIAPSGISLGKYSASAILLVAIP